MIYRRREKPENLPISRTPPSPHIREETSPFSPRTRRQSVLKTLKSTSITFIALITVAWFITIHYYERTQVHSIVNKCQWQKWEKWPQNSEPHRIALIADPQIVDAYSYPGRPDFFNFLIKKLTDNYLYRNHRFLQDVLDPDTNIFLGDLFDGGREWDDHEWFQEYKRFNKIFPSKPNRRTINSIPGNHDIGFENVTSHVVNRFSKHFGELNNHIELGNHSFLFLDTISLSHPDEAINQEPTEFLDSINEYLNPNFPRVLLSHVPLYRFNDRSPCGPLREKKHLPFPIQRGKQYQTVIDYYISQNLLSVLNPVLAFAGDDHDYCDIHQFFGAGPDSEERIAREIAVKSCAMSGGIKYPAIQLLSLHNPVDSSSNSIFKEDHLNDLRHKDTQFTYQTEMCYMPNPYSSLRAYFLLSSFIYSYLALKYIFPREFNSFLSKIDKTSDRTDKDIAGFAWNFGLSTGIFVLVLGSYMRSF